MLFAGQVLASPHLPRSLDLGLHASREEVPSTHSSNLIAALGVAVERAQQNPAPQKSARLGRLGRWLRARLREEGFALVAPEDAAAPAVVTIALEPRLCSLEVGERLLSEGFEVSFRSSYLMRRNWIQVCSMGEVRRASIEPLFDALKYLRG